MEMNNNIILFLIIGVLLIFFVFRRGGCGCQEKFCKVAPRFDHYYHAHTQAQKYPYTTGRDYRGASVDERANDNPIYVENGGQYSNHYAKDGVIHNTDTVGNGCKACGGDYISVAPKRDRYYQLGQGYLGDNILSGYPYYDAMGGSRS